MNDIALPSTTWHFSVPATSANLGPGFDTIGIALDLRLTASVSRADAFTLRFTPGLHAPTHDGYAREILRGFDAIAQGVRPPLAVTIENPIPLGKGLGSSAAAAVIGARIAAACWPEAIDRLPRIVTDLEGHPDNALPALLGGIVIAAQSQDAAPRFIRLPVPKGVQAVVVVPEIELATEVARALLPERYSRSDAVFTIQRAALLAAALAVNDLDLLATAMEDRLHQPYRAASIPGLTEALQIRTPELLGIALSGAGPSLLALVRSQPSDTATRLQAIFARHNVASHSWVIDLTDRGVESFLERGGGH